MTNMPTTLIPDHQTEVFTEDSVPEQLTSTHSTKAGTWAFVRILEGSIKLHILGADPQEEILSTRTPGIIEPEVPHRLEPVGEVRFYVQFFREPGAA